MAAKLLFPNGQPQNRIAVGQMIRDQFKVPTISRSYPIAMSQRGSCYEDVPPMLIPFTLR